MVSIWCELLCKLSIYTFKSDQWMTIWWEKMWVKCLLLIFTYSNSKFKVTCKMRTLNAGTSELIPKKNCSKISNITFTILPFSHKNTLTKLFMPNTLESTSLDEIIRCPTKWFILSQRMQNLEYINLMCVTYAQPIPLLLTIETKKWNRDTYINKQETITKIRNQTATFWNQFWN